MKFLKESILSIDSRIKLFSYLLIIIIIFLPIHNTGFFLVFIMLFFLSIILGVSYKKYLYLFINTLFIYLFVQFFNIFFITNDPLNWGIAFNLGDVEIYWYSIYYSLSLTFRFFLLFYSALIFSSMIKIDELAYAIKFYLKPLELMKISTDDLAIIITIAIRFLPILKQDAENIYLLQKSKKHHLKTISFLGKFRLYGFYLNAFVTNIFDKSDTLATAMENRGFVPKSKRTYFELHKIKVVDYIYLFISITIFILFILFAINVFDLIPRFLDPDFNL